MKKKASKSTIIYIVLFIVGLSVMLYPTISNWWNERVSSKAVSSYLEEVAKIDKEEFNKYFEAANKYNEQLADIYDPFTNYNKIEGYKDMLNIGISDIMGYINIPAIGVDLPIYHGTSEGVLNIAVGHLQGSSLPVGGASTHCVLSGHRGLPSARLFTDLDKVVEGDVFSLNILNETLYYEVEKILVILPNEMDKVAIIDGEDYVTLMTCTPYGINSHRLLIRSKRIYPDDSGYANKVRVSADAVQIDRMKVVPFVAVPLLILLMIYWNIQGKRQKKKLPIKPKYRL